MKAYLASSMTKLLWYKQADKKVSRMKEIQGGIINIFILKGYRSVDLVK